MSTSVRKAITKREAGKRQPVTPPGASKKERAKFEQLDDSLKDAQSEVNAEAKGKKSP